MPAAFSFRLLATDGAARHGEMSTPHGEVATPAFLPVGTQATVKGLTPEAIRASGADIVLANTYHLMLRPGAERIAALGGLHRFMNWPRTILTDSGGFQVMSLSELRKVEDKGVTFRSHIDGAIVELSPERAIEIQRLLGSDIAMQLDECLQLPAANAELRRAMQLSLAWAEHSKRAFAGAPAGHALFGIVQGGDDPALRAESARVLIEIGFDGYAIGGLVVGEPQPVMLRIVEGVTAALPADRPRYLMGVGTPEDLLAANSIQLGAASIVLLPLAGLLEGHLNLVPSTELTLSLAYLIGVMSLGASFLWFWLLRHGEASRVSAFYFLTPIFGLALGALLLGESVRPLDGLGLAAVAGGIVLVQSARAGTPAPVEET